MKQLSSIAFGFSCIFGFNQATADESGPVPVVMQFDWLFNAQFAGFFQAVEQGYYRDAGLNVELRGSVTTPDTVKATVEEPAISFGSAESNVILGEVARGQDLKVVGTMFRNSPMGWMYLADSGIEAFTDLASKRVGIHADGNRILRLLLDQNGADTTHFAPFSASHDARQIIEGTADALQCYYIDEFVLLRMQEPDRARVFLAADFGYRAYSQVFFTAASTVEEHPEVVRAFLAATKRGWQYAFDHKEATVDLIIERYNPNLNRDYQIGSLALIQELMAPEPHLLFAPMSLETWEIGMAYLLEYGLIDSPVDLDNLVDECFLP